MLLSAESEGFVQGFHEEFYKIINDTDTWDFEITFTDSTSFRRKWGIPKL